VTSQIWRGVWFSNRSLGEDEGARGKTVVRLDIPLREIRHYEWVEEGKPNREWMIPAKLANSYGPAKLYDHELRGFNEVGLAIYVDHLKRHKQQSELRGYRSDRAMLLEAGWIS
jgi:hypothetical protein